MNCTASLLGHTVGSVSATSRFFHSTVRLFDSTARLFGSTVRFFWLTVRLRRQPHGFFIPSYGCLILPHGNLARPHGFFGRSYGYADNRTVYRFYRTVYLFNRAGFWADGAKWSRNRMGFISQRAFPYPRRRPCSISPPSGGYSVPRFSCSRSMLSNNALKLPAPKPRAPIR